MATVTPETPARAIALGTFSSFGIGGILILAATLAVIAASDTTIATRVALTLYVRKLGGSIGTANFFNVLQSRLKTGIAASVVKYAAAAGLPLNGTEVFVSTYLLLGQTERFHTNRIAATAKS